jgi:hypothetical protein
MKCKLLLTCFFVIAFSSMNAQIKKGSVLIGGSLYFQTQKYEGAQQRATALGVSPAIGKAIRDNLISGVELRFSTTDNHSSPNMFVHNKSIGAGYFLRKYANLGKSFYLFGQAGVSGSYYDNKSNYGSSSESKNEGFNITLIAYPGIAYSLSNKLQLEFDLPNLFYADYNRTLSGTSGKGSAFTLQTSIGNGAELSVGLRVLLNKSGS